MYVVDTMYMFFNNREKGAEVMFAINATDARNEWSAITPPPMPAQATKYTASNMFNSRI